MRKNSVVLGGVTVVLLLLWSRHDGVVNDKIKVEIDNNKEQLEKIKEEIVNNVDNPSSDNLEDQLQMELLSYEKKVSLDEIIFNGIVFINKEY